MSGYFITFEGGEGSGKSTQIARLVEWAEASRGAAPLATREPGGTKEADAIRELILTGVADRWAPAAEALLMCASRHQHVEKVIRPALEAGRMVVCDRFFDSTRIYQGAVGGVPADQIEALERVSCGGIEPDLTFLLDVEAERGLDRANARGGAENRFESKGPDFHRRVREAYLELAETHQERIVVIDAKQGEDEVTADITAVLEERLAEIDAI